MAVEWFQKSGSRDTQGITWLKRDYDVTIAYTMDLEGTSKARCTTA